MNFNNFIFDNTAQMIMYVEVYTHIKTEKNVRINPDGIDFEKLRIAYSHAKAFFKEYETKFVLFR